MNEYIKKVLPEIVESMDKELEDQRSNLKMIASENYCSPAVREAMSSIFTDKYSEGYPYHRYYSGCDNVDKVEKLAQDLACELFGADYANVQPHSGSDANLIAYWAVLDACVLTPGFEGVKMDFQSDKDRGINVDVPKSYSDLTGVVWGYLRRNCHNKRLLSMDYYSGSHLTHGYRQNISSQIFDCYYYKVGDNGLLDYDAIENQAIEVKPLILLAGYSAYPRKINFRRFREIADKCGAVLMVDMAHFAGLVAGHVFEGDYDPVKWADIVTSTTHKTLRGPRGGLILCKEWLKDSVNKGCPLVMGGPLQNMIAAKAICFKEDLSTEFESYAHQIVSNSRALAESLKDNGIKILTDGTDNHMVLVDLTPLGLTGRQAEQALRDCGITCNRNTIPNDKNGPWYTSGLRLGTPALTTLGMKENDMAQIGLCISEVLKSLIVDSKVSKTKYSIPKDVIDRVRGVVKSLLSNHVPYPEL